MQAPQALQALPQQSPISTQALSQKQDPPPVPHWHGEQARGSSGQSGGQLQESSPALHTESPQTGGQAPQSDGQVAQVSPPLQAPSLQNGHAPQSAAHEPHVSQKLQ